MSKPMTTSPALTAANDPAFTSSAVLMRATVAACALMTHADGEVAPAERRRVFALLRENPAMSAVPQSDIGDEIAEHEANFRYDPELAEQIARERLAPAAKSRRAAARIVSICRELIPADGVAHPSEYRALDQIRTALACADLPQPAKDRHGIAASQWHL